MTDKMSTKLQGNSQYLCPPSWLGLIKQLVHLTQFSGGLQVLDGARGAGKTVIAQQLASALGDEVCFGVLALPAGLPAAQVFDCLLTALQTDVNEGQSVGESIVALRRVDANLKQDQLRKVLIIDDAHNFDDQALAALVSVFQGNNETEVGLSLVFIAEPGLAQRLDTLNLIDIEIRDSVIPALSSQEAKRLVASDFSMIYAERDFPFTEDYILDLWREAEGRPGSILKAARAAYTEGEVDEVGSWYKRIPIWHLLALFLLAGVLIIGYFSADDYESQAPIVTTGVLLTPDETDLLLSQANSARYTDKENIELSEEQVFNSSSALGSFSGVNNSQEAEQKFEQENVESFAKDNPELAPITAINSAAQKEPNHTVSLKAAAINQPALAVAFSSTAKSVPAVKSAPVADTANSINSPNSAALVNVKAQRNAPMHSVLTKDENFLLSRPGQGFVLQVLAANSLRSLEEFVAKQPNRKNLRIYRSLRSGKHWFVVVEGFYADKGSALAAKDNLPKSQLKAGPWPKSLAAVKLEITAFKQQTP